METPIKGNAKQVTQPCRGQMCGTNRFVKTDGMTTEVAIGRHAFVSGKGFHTKGMRELLPFASG